MNYHFINPVRPLDCFSNLTCLSNPTCRLPANSANLLNSLEKVTSFRHPPQNFVDKTGLLATTSSTGFGAIFLFVVEPKRGN